MAIFLGLLVCLLGTPAVAQPCAGDVDSDGRVSIAELIIGVRVALGIIPLEEAAAFDTDGDANVSIGELIMAVQASLRGCPEDVVGCGDGDLESGETCDDGNNFGGDGCAANCTLERLLTFQVGDGSAAVAQLRGARANLKLDGQFVIVAGDARDVAVQIARPMQVLDASGTPLGEFPPGFLPVVMPADAIALEPIDGAVFGGCWCLRGQIPSREAFGPGNAAAGAIGCSDTGLPATDYILQGSTGMDVEFSFSGEGIPGSALLALATRVEFLAGASCSTDIPVPNRRWGLDGMPCTTDDDPFFSTQISLVLTSGSAEGRVVGDPRGFPPIVDGSVCGDDQCITRSVGTPFDCGLLASDSERPVAGAVLAGSGISFDTVMGDIVLTVELLAAGF